VGDISGDIGFTSALWCRRCSSRPDLPLAGAEDLGCKADIKLLLLLLLLLLAYSTKPSYIFA
jgi:hypothetical protein